MLVQPAESVNPRYEALARALTRVNGEVWLPALFSGRGSARITLFFNHYGLDETRFSDYRKFKASATILPGVAPVETPDNPGGPTQP